jgi:LAGLIDADG DNA endonuclease family protein
MQLQFSERVMNTHRIAYFAGLIDGEGHIGIYKPKTENGNYRKIRIKVNMTSEETVMALKEFFGGFVLMRKAVSGCKQQWEWRVDCKKARGVLELIRPWLITKASKADEALSIKVDYGKGISHRYPATRKAVVRSA